MRNHVKPMFAKIRGQFVNNKDQLAAERKLISYGFVLLKVLK